MNRLTDSAQTYLRGVWNRAAKYAMENMEPFLDPGCIENLKNPQHSWVVNPSSIHLYGPDGRTSVLMSVDVYKSEVWSRMNVSVPQVSLREMRQNVESAQDFLKALEHLENIYADGAETIRAMHEDGQVWE